MKSIKEILTMLVCELVKHLDKIKSINQEQVYYNEILGDTSFLLAGLFESFLKKNYSEWNGRRWIDDSLITNVLIQKNKLKIDGIMIWGKKNTTEQWTDPFSFEIELLKNETNFREFTFWLCDLDIPQISYEEFRDNRDYWARTNRNWKYVINSNEALAEIC